MRDYVLLSDSCCDLDPQLVQKLDLTLVPLHFRLDETDYDDQWEVCGIGPGAFYDALRSGAVSHTAAANVEAYESAMRQIVESGKDLLCLCFSSALSSTYQSAEIAARTLRAEFPEAAIEVMDSLSASLGQGMLLYLAAREKASGKSLTQVRQFLQETIPHLCHWFTVDDLNYLKRGGRLSGAAALLGSMLNIKPILHMDPQGRLVPVGKVRGRKLALKTLSDRMAELRLTPAEDSPVFLCHGDCGEEAQNFARELEERFQVQVYVNYIGAVIGSHTGPDTIGLFFLGKER